MYLRTVKQLLRQASPSFDERAYGFTSLVDLLRAAHKDGAFRNLVRRMGVSVVDAAYVCATTPSRQLGLTRMGEVAVGMAADLAILTKDLQVSATFVDGRRC